MSNDIPKFKYVDDKIVKKLFIKKRKKVLCKCCEKETNLVYCSIPYCEDDIEPLCPECISNGKAAEKFDCDFIDVPSDSDNIIENRDEKIEELTKRTPEYSAWQQPYYPNHCDDFCKFISHVGYKELKERNLLDKIIISSYNDENFVREHIEDLEAEGNFQGYLFGCLKCGQLIVHTDFD
ncbi:CbrC family protein [Brachyspira alvinipulli]|uniref:CbrC family protein n=1 Tax=Brachyspira alvinipulli TaxID=84379 RepID=UPI003005624B